MNNEIKLPTVREIARFVIFFTIVPLVFICLFLNFGEFFFGYKILTSTILLYLVLVASFIFALFLYKLSCYGKILIDLKNIVLISRFGSEKITIYDADIVKIYYLKWLKSYIIKGKINYVDDTDLGYKVMTGNRVNYYIYPVIIKTSKKMHTILMDEKNINKLKNR